MSPKTSAARTYILDPKIIIIDLDEIAKDVVDFIYIPATKNMTNKKGSRLPQEVTFRLSKDLQNKGATFKVVFRDGSPLDGSISSANPSAKVSKSAAVGSYHYQTLIAVGGDLFVDAYCPTIIVN
jgi:hypothetical protein